MNHLLLIFKLYVYSTREKIRTNIIQLKSVINKINDAQLKTTENEPRKREKYCNK